MRIRGFQLVFLFLSFQTFGQIEDYVFEQISSDAGISFNAISTIVEDDYGFLWFGCSNGLFYYNTAEIIKYNFDPLIEDSPPSDNILKLSKDNTGRIWISTDNGICYFNEVENSFTRINFKLDGESLNSPTSNSILQYSENKYLIILHNSLYFFEIHNLVLNEIELGDGNVPIVYLEQLKDDRIYIGTGDGQVFVSEDSGSDFRLFYNSRLGRISSICYANDSYWIGYTNEGVEVVNKEGKLESRFREEYSGENQLPHNWIRKIVQRKNGEIWIGTVGGLFVIHSEGNRIIKPDPYNGLPHWGIFDLYNDRQDGVWIGTWSGGLAYYSDFNYKFSHIWQIKNHEPISRNVISTFAEDRDGNIWIGSENKGLYKFNPETKTYIESESLGYPWPVSRIKTMVTDINKRLWIGTFLEGLWVMEDESLTRVSDFNGIFSSILAVDNGIWLGDRGTGLSFYNTQNNTIKTYQAGDKSIGSISSDNIWKIYQDSREDLWICSDFGLSVKRKDEDNFERYFYNENTSSLSRNKVYTISEDRSGKLWIGTGGAGIDIYDPESNSFSKFRLNEALEHADIYCILMDQQENMWFSSNQGIYVYYHNSNTLKSFTQQDGLLGTQYHPNSGYISSTGKLYFGGGNGFNYIDPDAVKQNLLDPEVFLSKLLVNNRPIEEQEAKYVNSKFTAGIEKMELLYNQNSITVGFVSNNFVKSAKNRFRYRIVNYQDEWIETMLGADVSITKLPPGDYTLEVMASNNDGLWSKAPKEIRIIIHAPFWQAWYAYLFYILFFTGSFILVIRMLRFRAKSKANEMLFSEKVEFFTNVSHEFRTPLTLVLSPLNSLLQKYAHDSEMRDIINTVKRNADRLLRLTNQLLDFRMIELNRSKLKPEQVDLVELCKKVYDCFEFEVIEKQINCIFNSSFKILRLPVDKEKIDKVVYNLLSNALKYSPEKGQIILSLEQKVLNQESYANVFYTGTKFYGEALEIKVKDNGYGIKPETILHIFDRFYVNHERNETGTGIGLHICQEYVRLHNGHIMVQSEVGLGSSFIINLPIKSEVDFEKESIIIQAHFDHIPEFEGNTEASSANSPIKRIVLFAEDNDELRVYYKKLLSTRYKALTAKNGHQAFEIAREVIPDMIITDVLMPGMDGLEFTVKIRETKETHHIPIILLTALSDDQSKVESMTKGANAFLTKPVDESFLIAKIENIFRERESLKKKYEVLNEDLTLTPKMHESFIVKAEKIVEDNLQNPSFEISEFASLLSISKSSLQRKLKASVNVNPSEFIREVKLKKAVELMKKSDLNIDEISFLVGFNSTSYFIRTFKNKYGKTPAAYKSELK